MKYRKALTIDEASRLGWEKLQRGQWLRYSESGEHRGRFVGISLGGVAWIASKRQFKHFVKSCDRFRAAL